MDHEGCTRLRNNPGRCSGTQTWVQVNRRVGKRNINEAHLAVNIVPIINPVWRRWQGIVLGVIIQRKGLRIACSSSWIMGGLGFLVDGWEGGWPLLRYHTGAGEKVSLGAIAGSIVKRGIVCRRGGLRGRRKGELMVRIERI